MLFFFSRSLMFTAIKVALIELLLSVWIFKYVCIIFLFWKCCMLIIENLAHPENFFFLKETVIPQLGVNVDMFPFTILSPNFFYILNISLDKVHLLCLPSKREKLQKEWRVSHNFFFFQNGNWVKAYVTE